MGIYSTLGKLVVVLAILGGTTFGTMTLVGDQPSDDSAPTAAESTPTPGGTATSDSASGDGGSGVTVSTPAPTPTPTPTVVAVPDDDTYAFYRGDLPKGTANRADFENALTKAVESYRTSNGGSSLAATSVLKDALRKHAADMAARDYVNRTSPTGTSVADRINIACDPTVAVAKVSYEKTGSPSTMAKAVVDEWTRNEQLATRLSESLHSEHDAGMVQAENGDVFVVYAAC